MKYIITSILIVMSISLPTPDIFHYSEELPEYTRLDSIFHAICIVESGLNSNSIGAKDDIGIAQIRPIMVKDVNRIQGININHEDCFDPYVSKLVFKLYQDHYNPSLDTEYAIRSWNGGPKYKEELTDTYYKKVQYVLDTITSMEYAIM